MSREVLDSGSSDTERDEPDVPPARVPVLRRRWRGPAVLVLAFLLGAAAGGIVWDAWRDRQDSAAASSTVDLTARLRNVPTLTDGDTLVQGYVRIENDGPETVRIERISIAGPGYIPRSDDSIAPFGVESEQSVTQRIEFDIACDVSPEVGAQLGLQVQTADGVSRSLTLPLADEQRYLWELRPAVCQPSSDVLRVGVLDGGAPEVVVDQEPVLSLPVLIQTYVENDTVISGVTAASPQLTLNANGVPSEIEGRSAARVTLVVRINDCAGAADLNFDELGVIITGRQRPGPDIQQAIAVDPDVALDIAAFVADTCRAA